MKKNRYRSNLNHPIYSQNIKTIAVSQAIQTVWGFDQFLLLSISTDWLSQGFIFFCTCFYILTYLYTHTLGESSLQNLLILYAFSLLHLLIIFLFYVDFGATFPVGISFLGMWYFTVIDLRGIVTVCLVWKILGAVSGNCYERGKWVQPAATHTWYFPDCRG